MKILALDTSSHVCSVALFLKDKVVSHQSAQTLKQAQIILSQIDSLLKSEKVSLNQLDAIAFGCGPGSFTGIRIAASVTQGLAYALKLPVIPISSLEALAYATYLDLGWDKLLVGIDARMDEIYWGAYIIQGGSIINMVKETIEKPEKIQFPKEKGWFGVGNAWEIYRERMIYEMTEKDTTRIPEAKAVALLAKTKFLKSEWVLPHQALPVYLRDNVAKKG